MVFVLNASSEIREEWKPFKTTRVEWEDFQYTSVDITSTGVSVIGSISSGELSFFELGRHLGNAPNGPLNIEIGGISLSYGIGLELRSVLHGRLIWID